MGKASGITSDYTNSCAAIATTRNLLDFSVV
jgi:hypothetical protein